MLRNTLLQSLHRKQVINRCELTIRQCARSKHGTQLVKLLQPNARSAPKFLQKCAQHTGPMGGVPITGIGAKMPTGREIAWKLVQYVWPKGNWKVRRRVLFAVGLLIASKLLNVTVPFILRDIINVYNDKVPETIQLTLDAVPNILTGGLLLIFAYGCARAGSSLFNEFRNAVFARVAQHSIRNIAGRIFLHLHNLDLSFHLNRQTGALSKAIDRGTRGMSFVLNALVFNIVPTMVEVGLMMTIFYTKCGPEFVYVTSGCLGMYGVATIGITRWRTKFRHEMNQADNDAGNKAVDSLINYETVKYFGNEKFEAQRYDHHLQKYEAASLKTTSSLAGLNFVQNLIFSTGLIGVMYLATQNIQAGTMNVADLVMVNTLLFQLSMPLNFLGSVYREVRQGLQDMQNMFSLLNLHSKITEKPNAPELVTFPTASSILFKDVTFGYIPNQSPILGGMTFEVPSGKKVALVGGSGSGKSTIVRLLYRLYDSDTGAVTINDQNIKDVTLQSLRKSIAVVPQDCVLFNDTLFYNLHYGNTDVPEEKVYEAARMADLHDAIMRMPHGYQTMVGERGLKLSGGEKQRVAIARAMLKNSDIIVYDEATSSLDALTEENIMKSLKQAFKGKTSLFIAHRLATIVDADIIYVLGNGRVLESGTHAELLAKPGSMYAQLWNSQNRFGALEPRERKPREEEVSADELLLVDLDKCCGSANCNR